MRQIRIKDNSFHDKESFSSIPNLLSLIADKSLEKLDREGVFIFPEFIKDAEDVAKDQKILESYNDTYRTGNIMGFIGYGNEQMIIESRFSSSGQDFFFQYLLERVLDFPNIVNFESSTSQEERIFSLFVFLFPYYLKTALRKGIFKTYMRNKYNDSRVKGTIDIARHIKVNTPFTGSIAYNLREYSYDNYLTQLVRHTIEFIRKKSYGSLLLSKVKDEVKLINNATENYRFQDRLDIIEENKKNIVRHAYYREYRNLQQLCLLILQHQKHQVGFGVKRIYGILFDGAWLWEEYINLLVEPYFHHPMNKVGKGRQYLFDGNLGVVYPDFIGRDTANRVIADAKYKPMDNIGNKDYLQLLAYMFRFEAKKGFFLYPEIEEICIKNYILNRGTTYDSDVSPRIENIIKLGLRIPIGCISYSNFVLSIGENEKFFISYFI